MNRKIMFCAAALGVLVLAGCGKSSQNEKTGDKNTFTILTARNQDWGDAFQKGFVAKAAKKAGIKLKWDVVIGSDWGDKKSVTLSSGKLPDAFLGHATLTDQDVEKNKAAFVVLDDYIKDMPNLQKAFKEDPTLKAMCTSTDGHIYSLPNKLAPRPLVGNQIFINKKWIDKLGMKMPTTYKEFIEVLRAFRDGDPNGNGKKDEIPYGGGSSGMSSEILLNFVLPFKIFSPFGGGIADNIVMDNDKPIFQATTDRYKAAIEAMHSAYKEGLIDPQFFTADGAQVTAKKQSKTPIYGAAVMWTADAEFGVNADQYEALPPLVGEDGGRYVNSDPTRLNYNRNELVVTKGTTKKNIKKLMKWADAFYTNDATAQTMYGSFGVGTKKLANGDIQVLQPKTGSSDMFAWKNALRDNGMKYMQPDFEKRLVFDKANSDYAKLSIDKKYRKYALPGFPNVMYTPEELKTSAKLTTDINTFVTQKRAQWITKGGVEKDWNNYKKQLNAMGLSEFMKIQNAAYARWQDNLK
ncbi:extracellular solute-binding protein [Lacticaseibacillus parakribbianus]|uniref:extracellular solute-binding protein n=1 Tax=Lacticaseibacillus parakribbianus TaxID=2970927 RepID=UPI0021CB248F|nr:extracellular solute-binding protein [Lacticaseibacillus parakribbianus]